MTGETPAVRIRRLNDAPLRANRRYVLYWMVAARRVQSSFALQRAVELARELSRGLLIFEPLRAGYRWASDRLHAFVIEGMQDSAARVARLRRRPVTYYPYLEPTAGAGRGLLQALAKHAVAVVTDDYPCFFVPRMLDAAAPRLDVQLEAVDGNGVYPMRATDRVFTTAASFRRHLQKELLEHLLVAPDDDPLARLPRGIEPPTVAPATFKRWPPGALERGAARLVAELPIDHGVPAAPQRGGSRAARDTLDRFIAAGLPRYAEDRNQPASDAASGLSPYLHFGHISSQAIVRELLARAQWSPELLPPKATGSRSGWWGVDAALEGFLDQLITWRELGFNRCALQPRYADFDTLPGWALETLAVHASDRRPHVYDRDAFESAATHDPLWNAAQRQLVREGMVHNYLRMLWGKKVLEWTRSPREALEILVELNNKYALDGRDPNSYSGIFWIFGRFDRAWGPERSIFGKVRYMSSKNTARKVKVGDYLERYGASATGDV